jgi:DNA-binding CsgD family transcriptional regulator
VLARGEEATRLFEGPAAVAAPLLGIVTDAGEEVLPGTDPAGAAIHGLYWLVANLAAQTPLVLTVDDLHWVDTASTRFIAYLARRLDDLPVLLLTATRPSIEAHAPELLERLLSEPDVHQVEPAPLSERGVRDLLGSELGTSAGGELGRACHRATGGNPLFVRAVARAVEAQEDASGPDLPDAGSGAIARSVAVQLANLGDAATALARAVAVLGASGELRHAAAVTGLSDAEAGEGADALVGAQILGGIRPLEFAHPIVRSAVYREIPPAERARLHLEAARLLDRERADPEAVAPHLLASDARGDRWVVDVLRAAGARSLDRGAPEEAIRSLRRALEEPPRPDVRTKVLAELGAAEVVAAPAEEAIEHLSAALADTDDPQAAAHLALDLSLVLSAGGRWADAVTELERVAASVQATDPELARQLEAHLIIAAGFDRRTHPLWHEHLERLSVDMPAETPSDRLLLGALATSNLILGGRAGDAVVPAARAVDGGLVAERSADSTFVLNACLALAIGGDFDRCERALEEAFADARLRGSLNGFARVSLPAALLRLQQGRLAEAEGHARDMFEISRERGYQMAHLAHGALLEVQVERGDMQGAVELAPDEDLPDAFMHNWLLYGRGIVRLAQGRVKEAIADLEELGRREEKWRGRHPGLFAYRSLLARAWQVEGEPDRARDLVREELALARGWGTAGPIGRALRVLAALEEPEAGLALLRESLDVLEGSGYRLQQAKTLVELGAALRRSGARAASREPLYDGMELAHTCGADALVERAREELVATGARPRRAVRTGVDALTPSEQRVARLAADGMTNREIAAALFVTTRTVEIHLTHAYQKLDISSREQLPDALHVEQERARQDSNL